jgi:hypothetical protein
MNRLLYNYTKIENVSTICVHDLLEQTRHYWRCPHKCQLDSYQHSPQQTWLAALSSHHLQNHTPSLFEYNDVPLVTHLQHSVNKCYNNSDITTSTIHEFQFWCSSIWPDSTWTRHELIKMSSVTQFCLNVSVYTIQGIIPVQVYCYMGSCPYNFRFNNTSVSR